MLLDEGIGEGASFLPKIQIHLKVTDKQTGLA
jgi:hypothetical protein